MERCVGVRGRIGRDGELEPLDLETLPELDAEAIAVCLLFAFRDSRHEIAIAEELRRRYPGAHVVAPTRSHRSSASTSVPRRRWSTRTSGPCWRYLGALAVACASANLVAPLVMRSSGGLATLDEAAEHAAFALLSGPAAGVVGAARIAELAGLANALTFDMGGTSTDVCAITDGEARREHERSVAGFPVRLPDARDAHGRRGRRLDRLAGLGRSAPSRARERGSDPGPACYGRGGERPTVTDANLLLGRLPPWLPGGIELDASAARTALGSSTRRPSSTS